MELKDLPKEILENLPQIGDNFYLNLENYKLSDFKRIAKKYREIIENNPYKTISFVYDGKPKPAPRPRLRRGSLFTGGPLMYDPGAKDKRALRNAIKSALPKDWKPIKGEVHIYGKFYKPIPKSYSKTDVFLCEAGIIRPEKKPDMDNYEKTLYDAANKLVFEDDCQLVTCNSDKFYSVYPRIEVTIKYRENPIDKIK